MSRDEVIALARQAGWTEYSLLHPVEAERLKRFAGLVAFAEREACARLVESIAAEWMPSSTKRTIREECAAVIRSRT